MDIQNCDVRDGLTFKDVNPGEVFRGTTGRFYLKVKSEGFDLAFDIIDGSPAHFSSRDPIALWWFLVAIWRCVDEVGRESIATIA